MQREICGTTGLAGAEIICRTLAELGARHVFGIPGTQNVAFYEALRRSPLRPIVPTHELAAAFMAGAYHRVVGVPGVLATIPGPGLAYAVAGLAEAWLDSAAMVQIFTGPGAGAKPGTGPQAIDQRALLAPVTKAIVSVSRLDRVAEAVRAAWRLSLEGEPGPVALELARVATVSGLEIVEADARRSAGVDEEQISAAWRQIRDAKRPVILAGQGALGVADRVTVLAERLNAPVLTTPSARGLIDETHALAMGFDVLRGTAGAANALLGRSDTVIVLGAKLAHNGSAGGLLEIGREKTVRVDTSAAVLDATYPAARALEMEVESFLARPEARDLKQSAWAPRELAAARAAMRTIEPIREPAIAGASAESFYAALAAALPADARLVTDTGMHQVMTRRHFDVKAAGGLLMPSDLQSMGFGLPAAIAARLAEPSRDVVALIGDGGLRMTGFELATAVREGVALTLIVFNDGCLNQIRMQQLGEFGVACGTELGPLDLGAFAAAVGADYQFAGAPDSLSFHLGSGIGRRGVTLIEVPVGDTAAIRAGAFKARAKGVVRAAMGQGIGARLKALIPGH